MIDDTIKSLALWGCDTKGAFHRLFGEKELYIQLIEEYFSRNPINELKKAVESGDGELVFQTAHAMKGVLANLGLTPLFEPVSEITEIFRNGRSGDVTEKMKRLQQAETELKDILDET